MSRTAPSGTAASGSTADLSSTPFIAPSPVFPVARRGIRAVPLRGGRWRVTRESGDVLGYVERLDSPGAAAPRWRSSRMPPRQATLLALGEFDSPADALDVVRLG